jgi:hypothetical protein
MDRFKELTTFNEVAQRGLSAAARGGITRSGGTAHDQLEERTGVKS